METSLHRELKRIYAGDDAQTEVRLGKFRIDAVVGNRLFEIQHGSLLAIRDKIRQLCDSHRVTVVKPIIALKHIIRQDAAGGNVLGRRASPKRGQLLELFDELVYFTRAFPHKNLTLEVPLVEVEEWRYPGHGKRRRWRENDHTVEDQRLVTIREVHTFRTCRDLFALLPRDLPKPFHTGHLAEMAGTKRWIAQRIAYCLRQMGAIAQAGKSGNALLYRKTRKAA